MTSTPDISSRFKFELIGRIFAISSVALLIAVLTRILDPHSYGLLFLAISILSTIELFAKLGIARSAARYVSEYKEKDNSQLQYILRTSFLYNLATIVLVVATMLVSYQHIAYFLGEPDLSPYLLLGTLYIIFGTLTAYVRLILQGFELIKSAALVHAIDRGSRLVFAIGLVTLGYGALGALGGYVLGFFFATIVGLKYIREEYIFEYQSGAEIKYNLRRRIAEYTIPLTAVSTANRIDKEVDTILVGWFLNPAAVSFYVLGKQIVSFVEAPASSLGFTISPALGSEKADENTKRAAKIYEISLLNILTLYVPGAAGLAIISEPFIEIVFGTDYSGAAPVLQVFGIYVILAAVMNITSNGLDFLGKARFRAVLKGITAVLNLILNLLLIPTIGVAGAAISTVITYMIYTFGSVYVMHIELDLRLKHLISKSTQIFGVTILMSFLVFLYLSQTNGIISLVGGVVIGIISWGIFSLSVGLIQINDIKSLIE
ncbi:flippase [Natronococcus pandeyae]|uniref:Flippase n=1 Tax=Natronococcus pandeyae TaxID=2055836 RepID=A0A8J8Q0U7_9EURY|nr:oligosaccharide flippase family protein [Natronococcus pandeyae]TYL37247.1 flippase [Natronococcus pandeyae]